MSEQSRRSALIQIIDHQLSSAGVQMVWDCAAGVWLHVQLPHFTLVRCEEKEEFIKTFFNQEDKKMWKWNQILFNLPVLLETH